MENEVQEFKDRCEVLYDKNFPHIFNGHGDVYTKNYLMNNLSAIKEHHKRFGEEDCPLQDKDIVN